MIGNPREICSTDDKKPAWARGTKPPRPRFVAVAARVAADHCGHQCAQSKVVKRGSCSLKLFHKFNIEATSKGFRIHTGSFLSVP